MLFTEDLAITPDSQTFLDQFTKFATDIGLPPSCAQVLSYLLICQPKYQHAAQLQRTLALSSGSVNIAATMLLKAGLIEIVRLSHDRKYYYQAVPSGFAALTQRRLQTFGLVADIAATGLKDDPNNPRLLAIQKLYAFLDKEVAHLAGKLDDFKHN